MPRERLVIYVVAGAAAVYLVAAALILFDDYCCRHLGRGRWTRLDQLLADAEETATILKATDAAGTE